MPEDLQRLKVVDVSRVLAGPYCTMILGDLGADVVKVEQPGLGDPSRHNAPYCEGESHYFLSINRNKRSIAVDLRTPEGQAIFKRLIRDADVLVENFRPGKMEAFGLGYEEIEKINPRLLYCSISGFGQDGPYARTPAYNEVVQALSGGMSLNGSPDGPPMKLGLPVGDLAGGMYAVIGILAALNERHATGRGKHIDIALFDCALGLLGYFAEWYFLTGESPHRVGSNHHSVAPVGVFRTKDGRYLSLSIFSTKFWRQFCAACDRPDLAEDERFRRQRDRVANQEVLYETIGWLVEARTRAEWEELLERSAVPHAAVLSVGEALEHPQAQYRGMVAEVDHPKCGNLKIVGKVIKHDVASGYVAPPTLGQHTSEIMQEYDFSGDEIADYAAAGVIAEGSGRTTETDRPAVGHG